MWYGIDRGAVGELALQVATSAHDDAAAQALLTRAGAELAQRAMHLLQRFWPRPVAVAGRAFQLSPVLELRIREALARHAGPVDLRVVSDLAAHESAARLALFKP